MRLIAKTQKGIEYVHSKQNAFFAPNASAKRICEILNEERFRLKNESELWYVYEYDFTQEYYVTHNIRIYKGIIKISRI